MALDTWERAEPRLEKVYRELNEATLGSFSFRPQDCASPLPRAYQWADGSAYVTHVELVRKARRGSDAVSFWTDPLMYQGARTASSGRPTTFWLPTKLGDRLRSEGRRHHRRRGDGRDTGAR